MPKGKKRSSDSSSEHTTKKQKSEQQASFEEDEDFGGDEEFLWESMSNDGFEDDPLEPLAPRKEDLDVFYNSTDNEDQKAEEEDEYDEEYDEIYEEFEHRHDCNKARWESYFETSEFFDNERNYAHESRFCMMVYKILEVLADAVEEVGWPWPKEEAITPRFASFITRTSNHLEWLTAMVTEMFAPHIQGVLGNPKLTLKDLEHIPRHMKGIKQHGSYIDMFRIPGKYLYVGSAAGKSGLHGRLGQYNASGQHKRAISAASGNTNFRVVAIARQPVAEVFTRLTEGLLMIILQTLEESVTGAQFCPEAQFYPQWIPKCTTVSSGEKVREWRGLNSTWPMAQGLRRPSLLHCCRCGSTIIDHKNKIDRQAFLLNSDQQSMNHICRKCYYETRKCATRGCDTPREDLYFHKARKALLCYVCRGEDGPRTCSIAKCSTPHSTVRLSDGVFRCRNCWKRERTVKVYNEGIRCQGGTCLNPDRRAFLLRSRKDGLYRCEPCGSRYSSEGRKCQTPDCRTPYSYTKIRQDGTLKCIECALRATWADKKCSVSDCKTPFSFVRKHFGKLRCSNCARRYRQGDKRCYKPECKTATMGVKEGEDGKLRCLRCAREYFMEGKTCMVPDCTTPNSKLSLSIDGQITRCVNCVKKLKDQEGRRCSIEGCETPESHVTEDAEGVLRCRDCHRRRSREIKCSNPECVTPTSLVVVKADGTTLCDKCAEKALIAARVAAGNTCAVPNCKTPKTSPRPRADGVIRCTQCHRRSRVQGRTCFVDNCTLTPFDISPDGNIRCQQHYRQEAKERKAAAAQASNR